MRRQIEVSNVVAAALSGAGDQMLRTLEGQVGCDLFLRGNVVTLDGDAEAIGAAQVIVHELVQLVEGGHDIDPGTMQSVTSAIDGAVRATDVLDDVIWRHRATRVAPKTVNQKRYTDAIKRSTVTFAIGPAGTGKTFLAVAMAAAALSRKEVSRIILTRPAVEAGERLGFLPGDLMAKIDPYLRPLFDALQSMFEAEKVAMMMEKGIIEVAPLAFMRGRAQPVDRQVLTPTGWQAIGTLRIGDLVTGSDGRPTPVLGVFPQGRRPVFELRAQDGAATRCCAEHLWTVRTPDDRRHGRAGRTLRTDEMVGHLRRHHEHRFELPVVSSPVEFEPQDVPLDPYALGLLLADACITPRTTPSFSTADPELADALEAALPGIELERESEVDYVLQNVDGRRGGVVVAHPVTVALRELGLAGTRSATRFVPGRTATTRPTCAWPCSRACSTPTAGGDSGRPQLPSAVRHLLAAAPRRRRLPGPLARGRGVLAHADRGRPSARERARTRGPSPQRRVRARDPPSRGHRAVPRVSQGGAVRRARRRPTQAVRGEHRAGR